jgi:hypothetical protein
MHFRELMPAPVLLGGKMTWRVSLSGSEVRCSRKYPCVHVRDVTLGGDFIMPGGMVYPMKVPGQVEGEQVL